MCEKVDVLTEEFTQKQLDYIANIEFIREYSGHLSCLDEIVPNFNSEDLDVFVLGKPKNWRDDIKNHPEIIYHLLKEGIERLYIPNISGFTGVVCEAYQFDHHSNIGNLKIYNHAQTEGLVIPKKSATLLCTADCPTIIYHDFSNDILIVAHAGLGSVIDRKKALTGSPSRFHESVIDDIMKHTEETDNYEILIVGGIRPDHFRYSVNNAVYGNHNYKFLTYLLNDYGSCSVPFGIDHGGISVQGIIKKQLVDWYEIDPGKIRCDNIDTYSDPNLWSHVESVKTGGQDGRNGILVLHR